MKNINKSCEDPSHTVCLPALTNQRGVIAKYRTHSEVSLNSAHETKKAAIDPQVAEEDKELPAHVLSPTEPKESLSIKRSQEDIGLYGRLSTRLFNIILYSSIYNITLHYVLKSKSW